MSGKEAPSPPKGPIFAWGPRKSRVQKQEDTPVPERQRVDSLPGTSSVSCPQHADSPTSASSETSTSKISEPALRDAVNYMRKFLKNTHQEAYERMQFLECLDRVTSTIQDVYQESLFRDTLQFLLPGAFSPNSEDREMTLARITRLIGCIPSHGIGKGKKDLNLGQLAGVFTLCVSDPCDEVGLWAADGLHHLYTLIMQLKCRNLAVDSPNYQALMKEWGEEKLFWLAWFADVTSATTVFKRLLCPEELNDFMLMAIKGMLDMNKTKCATGILRAMLKSPLPELVKALKAVQHMYKYLEHITDNQARHEVFHYLCLLGSSYPEEVVKTLLSYSLQCDNTSAAMWRALTRSSDPATQILTTLQSILLEQPVNRSEPKAALNPLAAVSALYEILRDPTLACKEALRGIYPTLSIALICQISYTMRFTPQEIDIFWRTCIQQKTPTALAPVRSALRTFKALLRCASNGDEVLIMNESRGSELLINPSTHQKGLYLFARAMIKNKDCKFILPYLLRTLDNPEDVRHITVMTFLVELVHHQTFSSIIEYQIIQQLWKQLNATKVELRSLALDGMLHLAARPEKMAMLEPALPDILARLKDSNRMVNVKALKVLTCLLKSLQGPEVSSVTMEVANQVIPLFDDASHKVRLAAIGAFNCLFDLIKKKEKGNMEVLALQSLVPLMVHLYDTCPQVVQASWEALKKVDVFLKSFFQMTIHAKDPWNYCTRLLKRYLKKGEAVFTEQALPYAETPQDSLREVAIKLLEIIAMGSKCSDTISAIATVLNPVERDPESNTTDLTSRITEAMAQESSSEDQQRGCCGKCRKL